MVHQKLKVHADAVVYVDEVTVFESEEQAQAYYELLVKLLLEEGAGDEYA